MARPLEHHTRAEPGHRRRRQRAQADRRALERAGWRTLLEYHEDHVRDVDGRLLSVAARWTAEAEHPSGSVLVSSVTAATAAAAWARLRDAADRQGLWSGLKVQPSR